MLKVLFLTDSLSNGGTERQLSLLARYLPSDWEGRVWSLDDGQFKSILREDGIQVYVRPRYWRWDISPALGLWHIISKWKPDIIHTFGWMSTLAAVIPAKLHRIPLVDGSIRQGNRQPYRGRIMKWSLRWADRVIANSQAGLQAFKVDPKRGRVVHNGFDLQRLEMSEQKHNLRNSKFTVVMVGRMVPEKDFPSYFEAARKFLQGGMENQWIFWVVGYGSLRNEYIQACKDLIGSGIIRFHEPTLDVLPIVQCADVGVLLSPSTVHEGFSNAIMEYMACGLPVVCTDRGGNRELVVNGETGFLIPVGDLPALAEKLNYLRDNPHEAKRLGQAGRRRLLAHFTVESMVKKTIQVYEEVL
jgi:glycosyltransferase involved in cell wall biosynthesis